MKYLFSILFCGFLALACSKKEQYTEHDNYVEPVYDTTAIDSFSSGAISVDVAAQIRRSSVAYQDSLKAVAEAAEQAKKEAELENLKKEAEKKEANKNKEEPKKNEIKQEPENQQEANTNPESN